MADKDLAAQSQEAAAGAAEFAANMTQVLQKSQEIWMTLMEAQLKDEHPLHGDPLNTMPAFAELQQAMLNSPQEVAEKTLALWSPQAELWRRSTAAMLGAEPPEPVAAPARGDKRFKHEDWSQNRVVDYIKQSYLLPSKYLEDVADVGELDDKDRKKVRFYTRQFIEAMSPSNFAAMNPEVLETTLTSKGENLVKGLKMMAEDLERGDGKLSIRLTDLDKFEVGRDMATTPGKVSHQNNVMQLIQYAPTTGQVHDIPLLIIPPWINKYYILDLSPHNSMVAYLRDQGFEVHIISWKNPDQGDADLSLQDYLTLGLFAALDHIAPTPDDAVHAVGYCLGGTLLATGAAAMARDDDTRLRSMSLLAAQVDFSEPGELSLFINENQVAFLEDIMATQGYLRADQMAGAFSMLRSTDLIWSRIVRHYLLGERTQMNDLMAWNADATRMPFRMHAEYLRAMFLKNRLAAGSYEACGRAIALSDIQTPVFAVGTETDHAAPWRSVYKAHFLFDAEWPSC